MKVIGNGDAMKYYYVLFILLFALSNQSKAQEYSINESVYAKGIDSLFSLDIKNAIEIFDSMIAVDSTDAAAYFLKSTALYYDYLLSLNKISSEIDTLGVTKTKFDSTISKAINCLHKILESQKDNKDASLLLGAAYGFKGLFLITKNEFTSAYKQGKEGYLIMKNLTDNLGVTDSKLGVGLYDYIVGSAPWIIRLFLSGGDRERGIKIMEDICDSSKYNFTKYYAMIFLESFYYMEYNEHHDTSWMEKRIKVIEKYLSTYPNNYALLLDLAGSYDCIGKNSKSIYLKVIDLSQILKNKNLYDYTLKEYNNSIKKE